MTFYRDTLNGAIKWASIEFGGLITVKMVQSKTKARSVVKARWFVMAYLYATGRYSMPQIATALNLSDHTTVLYGLRRAHGHDGKPCLITKKKVTPKPLWKKEQFVNMVRRDGYLRPQKETVDFDELMAVGEGNLARFINDRGWS